MRPVSRVNNTVLIFWPLIISAYQLSGTVAAQAGASLLCRPKSEVCLKVLSGSHDGKERENERGECGAGQSGEMYIMQSGGCREVCQDGLTDYELGLDLNCDRMAYQQCADGTYLPVNEPCDDAVCNDFDDCYRWASNQCPPDEGIEPLTFVFNGIREFSFTCASPWRPWNKSEW